MISSEIRETTCDDEDQLDIHRRLCLADEIGNETVYFQSGKRSIRFKFQQQEYFVCKIFQD